MSDSPCHQRLSGGDATVIVSKGEYAYRWFDEESKSELTQIQDATIN